MRILKRATILLGIMLISVTSFAETEKDLILHLNKKNFEKSIKTGIVLVDFWASWCGPCRKQGPVLKSLSKKVEKLAKIAKVNVDDSPKLSAKYKIRALPTLVILKNGKEIKRLIGFNNEEQLLKAIKEVK